MIPLIPLSDRGITYGIYAMLQLMQDNLQQVMCAAKIHDGKDNYTFLVLLREPNSIGQFVAFINEWGTNDGKSGTGGDGFYMMRQFLKDHDIYTLEYDLSEDDLVNIGGNSHSSDTQRLDFWQEHVLGMCAQLHDILPGISNYPYPKPRSHR